MFSCISALCCWSPPLSLRHEAFTRPRKLTLPTLSVPALLKKILLPARLTLETQELHDPVLPLQQKDLSGLSTRRGLTSAPTATVHVLTSASNATAASTLCGSLSASPETLSMGLTYVPGYDPPLWTFPDCLYDLGSSSSIKTLYIFNLIVQGNATYPDPMQRLATAMNASAAINVQFMDVTFLQEDGSPYGTADLTGFFSAFPALEIFIADSVGLGGTLPSTIPSTMSILSLASNGITGTVPSGIFAALSASSPKDYWFDLSANLLTGNAPSFATLPARTSLTIDFSDNMLEGTVPANFLPATGWETTTRAVALFRRNRLTGSLPPSLWGMGLSLPEMTQLVLDFTVNNLSGTIPSAWLSGYSFPLLDEFRIYLPNNTLTGGIPSSLMSIYTPNVTAFSYYFDYNLLDGSIASDLTSVAVANTWNAYVNVVLSCVNNRLTGTLTLASPPNRRSASNIGTLLVHLSLSGNSLTGLDVHPNAGEYVSDLDVSNNYDLKGSINNLFTGHPVILGLGASNTQVSGNMPDPAVTDYTSFISLALDNTTINFCAPANRSVVSDHWASEGACSFQLTNANYCTSLYPGCASSQPPVTCAVSSRPTTGTFYCIEDVWTAVGTVSVDTLIIPAGTEEYVVLGNVTAKTIRFLSTGSKAVIDGCAPNLEDVIVDMTPSEVDRLSSAPQVLVEMIGPDSSCTDLKRVSVKANVKGSTCKRVKVESKITGDRQLSAVFSVSSSSCNTWWIILVSVVCGVVVLALTIFIIVMVASPKARRCFRPFEGSNGNHIG